MHRRETEHRGPGCEHYGEETVKPQLETISRRQVLGSVGVVGMVGLGFRRPGVTDDGPAYTDYTYARPDDENGPRLRVAWYSTYNGAVKNTTPGTDEYVDDYSESIYGPLVAESNVLPGDSGTVALSCVAEEMDARIRLFPTVAGDLSQVVEVAFWHDTGILGIGSCAGTDEIPDNPAYRGTLAAFSEAYGENGLLLRKGFSNCLSEGDRHCLGFAWWLNESIGNEWQGQGLEFGLTFVATQCGGML